MYLKTLFIIILAVVTFGCEEFLEVDLVGQASEDDFFKNINEHQVALNAAYNVLRTSEFQRTLAVMGDAMSDDFQYQEGSGVFNPDLRLIQSFQIFPDNQYVHQWYSINYQGIYRTNQLLSHIFDDIEYKFVNT